MLLRPAIRSDVALIKRCASLLSNPSCPENGKPSDRCWYVGEQRGVIVGAIATDRGNHLSWAVLPEFQHTDYARRMVSLIAQSGFRTRIRNGDEASSEVARQAGFECKHTGETEVWEAVNVEDYV